MIPATPPCFEDEQQWRAWHRLASLLPKSHIDPDAPFSYCADCTHEYKARMVREGRCGNRGGVIVSPEDVEEEE